MLNGFLFMAAMDELDELDARARSSFRLDATDTFLVLGAALILVGLIFFWAFFLRKRPIEKHGVPSLAAYASGRGKSRRRSSSRRPSHDGNGRSEGGSPRERPAGASSETSPSGRRSVRRRSSKRSSGEPTQSPTGAPKRERVRRRRRHHPDSYPRNPTLGETGGLPPVRPEDPEPEEGDSQERSPN